MFSPENSCVVEDVQSTSACPQMQPSPTRHDTEARGSCFPGFGLMWVDEGPRVILCAMPALPVHSTI